MSTPTPVCGPCADDRHDACEQPCTCRCLGAEADQMAALPRTLTTVRGDADDPR